ncbi:membrane protein [Tritrichomonas foetus]|uniref:Membrane protein n=1 Tax=Tritrichomonas foetus TaxID=1144522 RepID=A0A1J4KR47_9EUKA|nr:membrane protein [Tritrichomonas foetus]|eukprot:OHT13735.1 membrane protein [Tritrichomonas foetus]
MSLRKATSKSRSSFSFGNEGPKRGTGKFKPTPTRQSKTISSNLAPRAIGHRLTDPPRAATSFETTRPGKTVPLVVDNNNHVIFLPNEGPINGNSLPHKRISSTPLYMPNEGPIRGKGQMQTKDSLNGTIHDQKCLKLVNEFRSTYHLPPLKYSKVLSDIAMKHTLDMLHKKLPLGHAGFHERHAQVPYASSAGENVGYVDGYSDPIQVLVDGWIKSPGHRKNLLGNFNQVGLAFANIGALWYGTQFFALI